MTAKDGSTRPTALRLGRRVSPPVAALLLALTACALLVLGVLAGRAGPLIARPPTVASVAEPTSPRTPVSPPPLPSSAFAPGSQQSASGSEWGPILVALGVGVAILFGFWLVRVLRRPRRIDAGRTHPAGTAPVMPLASGGRWDEPDADAGDERTFDPRRAAEEIIAVWVGLEAVADSSGCHRRSASTPTEFLETVTQRFGDAELPGDGADDSSSASLALLRLYQRARFDVDALAPSAAAQARLAARELAARMGEPFTLTVSRITGPQVTGPQMPGRPGRADPNDGGTT